jgi:hypothetical protein
MNDALARLRNRQRPTVPNRDASLTSGSEDISTSRNQDLSDIDISTLSDPESQPNQAPPIPTPAPQEISSSRHPDIEIPTVPAIDGLRTKQSTLRLETGLSDRLQRLCRSEGICREVLIEALYEHFEANPDAQPQVLSSAQAKNEHRQHLANLKRAQSMMKRFGRSK